MEVVLAVATLLGGVTAVWFVVDKFRERRREMARPVSSPRERVQPSPTTASGASSERGGPVSGATQSGRHPFFIGAPHQRLDAALADAKDRNRPVFLVIYDDAHPSKSQLYYALGCFLDYFTTKKLVEDHFVAALVPVQEPGARELIPEDNPLEKCLWVVLSPDGAIVRREGVYANPDEGLKRVREVVGSLSG